MTTRLTVNEGILQRIRGEFLEMPGLRLTCKQAQRLWGLDEQSCRDLLEFLVDAKFLYRPDHASYSRAFEGRTDRPRLRMAHAPVISALTHHKTKTV